MKLTPTGRFPKGPEMQNLTVHKEPVYWLSPLGKEDDFGQPYGTKPGAVMIDGKTMSRFGQWANMTPHSWEVYGCGWLGTGFGQKYELQADGRWLKVEG